MADDGLNMGEHFNLLKTVPAVLRARGFRLYTDGGRRLIDLWLNGGAAVLGHTPPNMLRELKNTASRGLYAPFVHFTEGRYIKALTKLLPGYCFRLYASPPVELASFVNAGVAKLWRPFTAERDTQVLIPVVPGIQSWRYDPQAGIELPLGLCVIAVKQEHEANVNLPAGDPLPPVLLAVAARGVHDIIASPQRAKLAEPTLPRTFKALQNNRWKRQGIYLRLKEQPQAGQWAALFKQFLEAGFLLPPTPFAPMILPGELSAGEDAKLASVLNLPGE